MIVQKYLHDVDAWNALTVEAQERSIGRTKLAERRAADGSAAGSHRTLNTILDPDGKEQKILRDNMPFGRPGHGRVRHVLHRLRGTPGGARADAAQHVHRRPPGDPTGSWTSRRAVTGSLFFVPSADFLEALPDA